MKRLLIVVDMQNDFVDGALGTKEAIAIVPKIVSKIQNFNGEVIYTRDTHDNNYQSTQEGKKLPVVHCVKDSKGWQLVDQINVLAQQANSRIFDKPAFGCPEMAQYVTKLYDDNKVDEVEFVGVCTDICVISNSIILKSNAPELRVIVDSSCCAGVTPESHDNALRAMAVCQMEIV